MPIRRSIFLGITPSACRTFVAEQIKQHNPSRIYFPCAGRFTVAEVLARMGFDRDRMMTSDIGLFSSVLGYLADPARKFDDLVIQLPSEIPVAVDGSAPLEVAAHLFTYLQYRQIKPNSVYGENQRREMAARWSYYSARTKTQIENIITALRGIHYEIRDMWDVIKQAQNDEGSVLYCSVPSYDGGYTKMYAGIQWAAPTIAEFDPSKLINVLSDLRDSKCKAYLYMTFDAHPKEGRLSRCPEGWHAMFSSMEDGRHSVIITNREPGRAYAPQTTTPKPIKKFPIYNEQEITDHSVIQFCAVDRECCLYYRDLFVHKLGVTDAECHLLMLIDGRVVTALGLTTDKLRRFASDYINEVFGISVTSTRYSRLGKLFMLCLTSGSMREFLIAEIPKASLYGIRHARGIRTSSVTSHSEGKTDRSVMRLMTRERLPDGRYKITYQADFRNDTWAQVLKMWLAKWGCKQRAESVIDSTGRG